jgi:hypothetical protein
VPSHRRRPLLARTLAALAATAACGVPAATAHADGLGADPVFAARQTLAIGGATDPRSLAVTDLDGDGRLDLVAGSAGGGTGAVSVLRGTGGGAFAAPLGSPFGLGTTGGVGAIAIGDLNGDARPDVAAAIGSGTAGNDELVSLTGDGTGALSAGTPATVAAGQLTGVALADFDGDGDLDAVTASEVATDTDQLGVLENGGGGIGLVPSSTTGASGTQLATAVAAGDLDGDHAPDALVASRNAGTGSAWVAIDDHLTFDASAAPVPVGADPVAVTLADLDGDGDLDGLVLDGASALVTLLRNDGAGGLTATGIAVTGLAGGTGIATGDLNGDGALDIVVTDGAGDQIGVLRGDGTGTFADPAWTPVGAGPRSPIVADLTGDGRPDVATADSGADALSLLPNAGTPAPAATLSAPFGTETVGRTGTARTVTLANGTAGTAALQVTGVAVIGDASDDFLVSGDTCTGQTVPSGGAAPCAVRLRFAPSAAGARTAALRVRYATAGGGTASYDVALAGTGAAETATADDGTETTATTATTTATTTTAATPPAATAPAATATPKPAAPAVKKKIKPSRLILTVDRTKLTAKAGASVKVGFALGRAAVLVVRVKHGGRTVDIVRGSGREGRGTVTWDGRLGRKAAPKGTYRIDVYAVAPDGRAARKSITLTVK